MNRKNILCILFFILYISNGFSQVETIQKKNSLTFSSGYTIGYLKNLAFAPVKRYDYNALNYYLKYTRTTKKEKLFIVELNYLNSELETTIIPKHNPLFSKIDLSFSLLKQAYRNEKTKIYIGLQTQVSTSSYLNWNLFDVQQKLGVAARFNYKVNGKHSITSQITIPFVLLRLSSFEDGLYSLDKHQSILWNVNYKYNLSKYVDLIAKYNFNYNRLQIFNAYRELQHQINLGVNFKF